jgi:hypothetical protein
VCLNKDRCKRLDEVLTAAIQSRKRLPRGRLWPGRVGFSGYGDRVRESVVADTHEARGQYVLEESSEELLFIQGAGLLFFGRAVGVAKTDLRVPMPEYTALTDGGFVDVTG